MARSDHRSRNEREASRHMAVRESGVEWTDGVVAIGDGRYLERRDGRLVVVEERFTAPPPVRDWPWRLPVAEANRRIERARLIEASDEAYGPEWKRSSSVNAHGNRVPGQHRHVERG